MKTKPNVPSKTTIRYALSTGEDLERSRTPTSASLEMERIECGGGEVSGGRRIGRYKVDFSEATWIEMVA